MNRLKKLTCIGFLTAFFLMCVGVTIAVLDELARVPFYHTLPVTAAIVNAIVLMLARRKRWLTFKLKLKMPLFRIPVLGGTQPFKFPKLRIRQSAVTGFTAKPQRSAAPSAQEAGRALRNLHSIIWTPKDDMQTKNFISRQEVTENETRQ